MPGSDATRRDFTMPVDFDSDYLTLHTTRNIGEAARVAKAVKAAKIEVAEAQIGDGLINLDRVLPSLPNSRQSRLIVLSVRCFN